MLSENLKYKLSKNCGTILYLLALLGLLVIVIPYDAPSYWQTRLKSNKAFSDSFTRFLKYSFEDEDGANLKNKLNAQQVGYNISRYKARLTLYSENSAKRYILLYVDKPKVYSTDLGYAYLAFEGYFKKSEKKSVISLLKNTGQDRYEFLTENNRVFRSKWHAFADLYAHLVMIILSLALFFLFARKWKSVFRAEDRYLWAVLAIGFINVFIITRPAIGDIQLHFFNEIRNIYRWNVYGPGNAAFQKLIYRIFFASDTVLFNANMVFAVLSAVPLYVIVNKRFGGRTNAVIAALMLVSHPTWLRYGASDLTHPWSIFLFLSAVALIVHRKTPHSANILLAFILLALSMLGRGEFMMFAVAALLLVGSRRIIHIIFNRTRAVIWGMIIALLIVVPQVVTLKNLISQDPDQYVHYDWLEAISTWFMFNGFADGYNTFADLQYSPWLVVFFTVFGFLILINTKTLKALALLLCTTFFLWNPYFFVRVFSSTHYQLPALPFYIILASIGAGTLVKFVFSGTGRTTTFGFYMLLTCIFWYISVFNYRDFLQGQYTYMNQYRLLAEHKELADPDCALVYTRPQGDYDLHNPYKVWFASKKRYKRYIDLPFTKVPDINRQCLYYLKTPGCSVVNTDGISKPTLFRDQCEEFESNYILKPVWESTIKAKDAVDEDYFVEDIPVGLYKLEKK